MSIRRISNSEVSTYKDCPRRWWLSWHRGLRPKHEPLIGALAIGSREHEALAQVYTPGGLPLAELPTIISNLLEDDRRLLDERFGATVRYPELKKKFESEAELQKIMLEGYVEWVQETGADAGYEVIGAEEVVEAPFYDSWLFKTVVHLIGRLDVRLRRLSDGRIVFIDHKTIGSFIKIGELRRNPQMKMYRLLLQLSAPGELQPGGAIYSQLRKVKRTVRATPPFYHREPVNFNKHELDNFQRQLIVTLDQILLAEDMLNQGDDHIDVVPPHPTRDCDWKCPFAEVCPMYDDGSRAEDYVADHFITDNPLHYYDTEGLTRHDESSAASTAHALPTAG